MENKTLHESEIPEGAIKRRAFFSWGAFLFLSGVAALGWKWMNNGDDDNGLSVPLRKMLNANEKANNLFFSKRHLAKEYPKEMAMKRPRINGDIGMDADIDMADWNLTVHPNAESTEAGRALHLSLADITALPKKEFTFDFKCIEGWSQLTFWGGVKFSDFLTHFKLGARNGQAPDLNQPEDLYKYVGLVTPDGAYYVGVDMKSMIHPQTILASELNGVPLPMEHGYPLRLIIPVKYGVKNIKRIGSIFFSDTKPGDYWFEQGYDYDCAL